MASVVINLYLAFGEGLYRIMKRLESHILNLMQPHSNKLQLSLTKSTEVTGNLKLMPRWQRLVKKLTLRSWRLDSIRAGQERLPRKWLPFSGEEAVAAVEVVAVDGTVVVVEMAADPETVEAAPRLRLPQARPAAPKSILLQTQGGPDQDTPISLLSTRARSTGTGASQRDSARSHGRAHGRIFIANLPRIMVSNEAGTSPFKQ